jgi:uncharacterized protein (DUF983 family)
MGEGKHCPNCGKDIGVWPIFSASWPSFIWCPWCRSRLRYRKTSVVMAALVAILIAIAAIAFILVSSLATSWRMPIWAMVMIISWVFVQLAVTWFLRNRRELELAGKSRAR